MLRSFSVTNHRSLRDEQELVLLPSYDKAHDVLPVAAIYGANAAGKSNLVDALRFLQRVVRDSYRTWEPGTGTLRTPFRLDVESVGEPSTYVLDLVLDGVRYVYGISLDDEAVTEEWLYRYPEGHKQVVFERTGEQVKLGSTVPAYRRRQDLLGSLVRDNASTLGTAAMADFAEAEPVYTWFRTGLRLRLVQGRPPTPALTQRLALGDDRQRIVELLRVADLGIVDLRLDEVSMEDPNADLELQRLAVLREALVSVPDESREQLQQELRLRERWVTSRPNTRLELRFLHGENRVPLAVQEQSTGTLAWLGLVTTALDVLAQGGLLCVDEIDASLHPRLTARLVSLFKDEASNPRSAQLVFTTHDASLLGTALGEEVLARDEVWFVEKDRHGATSVFALTDFKPRQGENRERRYLGGSYGAVPFVTDEDFRQAMGLDSEVA